MSPTFATATVVTALFAGIASASHPAIGSINTTEFQLAFAETGIVPEILPAIDPAVSFYFGYLEEDGDRAQLMPAHTLSLFEAQQFPFEFFVEGLDNLTEIDSTTRYLIYIADVDYREMPSSRILRRYLAGNFTVTGPSTVLEGSYKLETNSTPFTEFRSPNPQPGTGVHRYLSGLYIQPERFNSIGFEAAGMNRTRANWSLDEWRTQLGLGPAIGATTWMINATDEASLNASPRQASFSGSNTLAALAAAAIGAFALL